MAVHQFADVTEAATASYKTRTITPFAVVMRICRRVEAAWQNWTERAAKG